MRFNFFFKMENNTAMVLQTVVSLDYNLKFLIYNTLHEDIKNNESELVPFSLKVNDPSYLKDLLNRKKEEVIVELVQILPFLNSPSLQSKVTILKILPIFFSYVTLYDMKPQQAQLILDIVNIHYSFRAELHLFKQWSVVFNRRQSSRRVFSYKDETFFQNLPKLDDIPDDHFVRCIGYSDVALLRAFHRWLRLHRLHKYLFVFSNLTYEEVLSLTFENIDEYQCSVGLFQMTIGAKNKILREVEELRKRKIVLMENVITKYFQSVQDIEQGIRDVKKIIRTPIKVNDQRGENLPAVIVKALQKMYTVVLQHVGTGEGIIPMYGLLISVLKEAWNYTIFTKTDKESFNTWRVALSEKINNQTPVYEKIPQLEKNIGRFDPDQLNFDSLYLVN